MDRQITRRIETETATKKNGKTTTFIILICLVGLWFILSLTSCKQKTGEESVISVAYIENASCWPFFVAAERGLFEKAGLKVEAVKAKDSSEAMNALLANKVGLSVENTYSVIFAIESQSAGTLKLLVPCAETKQKYVSHLLVPVDSNVTSVTQIRGKRIGTYTGATQVLTLKLFLKKCLNLDPEKDVTIVQVDPSLQVQALLANQFDVLFTIEPFGASAIAKGYAKDILPFARGQILNPFPAGACSVIAQTVPKKRKEIKIFYEVMVRAKEFIERNPDEAKAILAKWTNLDIPSVSIVKGYEYYSLQDFSEEDKKRVQDLADLYAEAAILPRKINTKDMFINRAELY